MRWAVGSTYSEMNQQLYHATVKKVRVSFGDKPKNTYTFNNNYITLDFNTFQHHYHLINMSRSTENNETIIRVENSAYYCCGLSQWLMQIHINFSLKQPCTIKQMNKLAFIAHCDNISFIASTSSDGSLHSLT